METRQTQRMLHLNRREQISLLLALGLFSVCSFPWLSLPGPYQDELLFVQVLEPFAFGSTLYSWTIAGAEIPVMVMTYVGTLKTLVMKAVFALFPVTVSTVRAVALLLGAATLWLTLIFLRRHYSSAVAVVATLLLATDPSFIHTIRIDWGPVAFMQLLKMAGLALISGWLVGGNVRLWIGGMFIFGLALWDKATFVWFLLPLALCVLALFPKETAKRFSYRIAALGLVAFLLGSLPFWMFNVTERGTTASENWSFELRPEKLYSARGTLDGSAVLWLIVRDEFESAPVPEDIAAPRMATIFKRLGHARTSLSWPLMVVSVLLLPITLLTRHRRAVLFPLLLSLGSYLVMFVFRGAGGSAHHVVMFYPFPLLFVAVSLAATAERWKLRGVFPVVVAATVLWNLSLNARYLAGYAHTGGSGSFTDAIYPLISHTRDHPACKYYLFDFGLSTPFAFLGQPYEIDWEELFGLYMETDSVQQKEQRTREVLANDDSRLIVRGKGRTVFPGGRKLIEQWLAEGRIEKSAEFRERMGVVAFEVYRPTSTDGTSRKPSS